MNASATSETSQLPNVLMILVDQDRATQHYPEGWEAINLPNLTLLKDNGISFRNGFCNSCMCSPSRSTLFTGLYPSQHNVTDTLSYGKRYSAGEISLSNKLFNLATMMRPHYDAQFRGKWHVTKGGNTVHRENDLTPADVAIFGFNGWMPQDAGEDTKLENFGGGYANHDARYCREAIEYISDWNQKYEASQADPHLTAPAPFFMILSLVNPHDVLSYPNTYIEGGYSKNDLVGEIGLPATVSEDLLVHRKPKAHFLQRVGLAGQLGALETAEDKLNYLNFYANLQKLIDTEVGAVMDLFYAADSSGNRTARDLANQTVIIRVADHGEMGMAHGGMRQKTYNAYEESIRIPYIFSNPSLFPGGFESDHPISLIDLMPTLAGFLNSVGNLSGDSRIAHPPRPGCDVSSVLVDPGGSNDPANHTQVSTLFSFDDIRAGNPGTSDVEEPVPAADRVRCLRTHTWKYVRYFQAEGSYEAEFELYFIAGIHQEDTYDPAEYAAIQEPLKTLQDEYEANTTILQRKTNPKKFDVARQLLEILLKHEAQNYPYESVNLAYPDPATNLPFGKMLDELDNPELRELVIAFLIEWRQFMAEELAEREQDLLREKYTASRINTTGGQD